MKETTFEEKSGLRLFSLGIVIEGVNPNRPPDEIIVSPIESMNIQTPGLMVTPKKELRAGHPDEKGKVTKNKLEIQDYVRAKWISLNGSNRVTPPTVYPNETVILYKYSNHDEYYWSGAMHEPHLRRKEAASFAFSNMPAKKGWDKDGKPIAYNRCSSYWFEVDSFKKLVSLTTPKNDGEKAAYVFSINGVSGTVTISDDKGTSITLNTDIGISIITVGSVNIIGPQGVNIRGARVNIGDFVWIDDEMETKKDVIVNGDLYTNTLYCDTLVEGYGPTRNKYNKGSAKPVPGSNDKRKNNDKKTDDEECSQRLLKSKSADKATDWLLGINRPEGLYNPDGSVNAKASESYTPSNVPGSSTIGYSSPETPNEDAQEKTDTLLKYKGVETSTYVPDTVNPTNKDWRGIPIESTKT